MGKSSRRLSSSFHFYTFPEHLQLYHVDGCSSVLSQFEQIIIILVNS